MPRNFMPPLMLACAAALVGCDSKSAPASRVDGDSRNPIVANTKGTTLSAAHGDADAPLEPAPVLDPWMKLPPMALRAQIQRLLYCGHAMTSPLKCNLYREEGAMVQSPTEEQGQQHYAIRVWVTAPAEIYGRPPTEPLPRAPFRVVHHLLPQWREADAWLAFALRNARRACGIQSRVGNALVHIYADFGIENTYIVTLELSPYRASVDRRHVECIADEVDPDTDHQADVIATGRP